MTEIERNKAIARRSFEEILPSAMSRDWPR